MINTTISGYGIPPTYVLFTQASRPRHERSPMLPTAPSHAEAGRQLVENDGPRVAGILVVGIFVGLFDVGSEAGDLEGFLVGESEGLLVVAVVGIGVVGFTVGPLIGLLEGAPVVGFPVGLFVGFFEGVPDNKWHIGADISHSPNIRIFHRLLA